MIKSFKCAKTEKLSDDNPVSSFASIQDSARIRLTALEAAKDLRDLKGPGMQLEKLKGDRKGQHSIRINKQYRICFKWTKDGIEGVEIIDYH